MNHKRISIARIAAAADPDMMLLVEAIDLHANVEAIAEIEARLDLQLGNEDQEPINLYLAFLDAYDFAEEGGYESRTMLRSLRKASIAVGIYREIGEEEMNRTVVSGRGRKYDFQLEGKRYVFDRHPWRRD